MSVEGGPDIVTNGLVMTLDAANVQSFIVDTIDVEYLIVAGGGAGGLRLGGGGGGGGVLTGTTTVSRTSYSITVGAGGSSMSSQGENGGVGYNGGNSSAFSLTATGGGGGGAYNGSAYVNGASGGSGGGGGAGSAGGAGTTGQGTAGRNNNSGGISSNLPSGWSSDNGYNAGGGGGAGGQGTTGTPVSATGNPATAAPSNGGIGVFSSISGTGTYYGGGGGGHQYRNSYTNASGGLGGGGRGGAGGYSAGQIAFGTPTNGTANTGGGGGGGGFYSGEGGVSGAGGSGIVIVRYPGPQKAKGGTVTTSGGYTIHTFTTSGTFEVGSFWGDINNISRSGELINGPTFNSSNGGSIVFDGSNDNITLPASSLTTTQNFTIEAWVKLSLRGDRHIVVVNWTGWAVEVGEGSGALYPYFTWWNGSSQLSTTWNLTATVGGWTYLCATFDGSTARMYVNGVQSAQYNSTSISYSVYARQISGTTFSGPILGNVATVRNYNAALTAAQVTQNFNATRDKFGI